MRRMPLAYALLVAVTLVFAVPALADPALRVDATASGVVLRLDGTYPGAWYRVFRAGAAAEFAPLSASNVLCTGDCLVQDSAALPGRSYRYRFDLLLPSGDLASYGPYLVTVPDRVLAVRLSPNPGGGPARIELSVPGASANGAVRADVRIVDLQGRTVRTLLQGTLARGVTSLAWDGRGDGGRTLAGGIYFLSVRSTLGNSATRIIRLP
jgi:hypothetical protein